MTLQQQAELKPVMVAMETVQSANSVSLSGMHGVHAERPSASKQQAALHTNPQILDETSFEVKQLNAALSLFYHRAKPLSGKLNGFRVYSIPFLLSYENRRL